MRLGMACTFSTVKHRGDHQTQDASINKHTPHQQSLDWLNSLPQPFASSSCKDTEHNEESADKGKEKQPPVSSLPDPEDGDGDGIEDDTCSTFDLSFLANFDHEPSDHDGMDTTSLAFFSAILPSTQPETEAHWTTDMSGTFPLPSLISDGESQRCLLPVGHTHLQDPALLDICFATATSTAFPSGPSHQSCGCLEAIVFAVEKLEESCHAGRRSELDSIIACQKEAIKHCRAQLECSSCITKREVLVLLVFMLEKIVAGCGRIVGLYCVENVQGHLPSSLLPVNSDQSLDLGLAPSKSDWRKLPLGNYEINSPLEWEHMVRALICLQLRAVMELLADVKSMKSEMLGETLTASLTRAGIRLGELEKDICIF